MKYHKLITIFFSQKEEAVTAIEYALIASLIAMAIVVSVGAVGTQVLALYQSVADAFQ
jgi:pilus assembly protein Flp/PilA